jgi:hypothetical protein
MALGATLRTSDPGGMTTTASSRDERSRKAKEALDAIPHGGRDAVTLRVHCARSHHVATVYDTSAGLVYAAPVRARSHGSFDLPDAPHSGHESKVWLDLLGADPAMSDDALPAWCDCGQRTLSRAEVLSWVAAGEHRVVIA